MGRPDALHAAVLRMPARARRDLDIDVAEVLDVEGVHAVCTYDDLQPGRWPSRCPC